MHEEERQPSGGERNGPNTSPTLTEQTLRLLHELPGLLSDRVELVALEAERAGHALTRIVVLGLFATLMLATVWLALWGLVLLFLFVQGWSPGMALALVLLANLAAAGVALHQVGRLLPRLGMPATRRHLGVFSAAVPQGADATVADAPQTS